MDSEAVFHFVVAKPKLLLAVADELGFDLRLLDGKSLMGIQLGVVQDWGKLHCKGEFSAWIQYSKGRVVVAQFEDPNDAFAFKMRFG